MTYGIPDRQTSLTPSGSESSLLSLSEPDITEGQLIIGADDAEYLKQRIAGRFKSSLRAAKILWRCAEKHTGGRETKINRLRRKFGTAWNEYQDSLKRTELE